MFYNIPKGINSQLFSTTTRGISEADKLLRIFSYQQLTLHPRSLHPVYSIDSVAVILPNTYAENQIHTQNVKQYVSLLHSHIY